MKLPVIQYRGITIPEIDTSQDTCVIIELGLSINKHKENIFKHLKTTYKVFSILSVGKEFRLTFWERYFKKLTLRDYFKKHKLSDEDIAVFFEYAQNSRESCLVEDYPFREVYSSAKKAVYTFILTRKSRKIIVDTMGMHIGLVVLTYKILQDFVKNGGFVIEVGYPHSPTMECIEDMLQTKVKSIQLGTMQAQTY